MEAEEDVQSVLTQETHELADILGYQDDAVLSKLYKMMDSRARERLVRAASHRERILEMLGYFSTADPAMCRQFLQMVCMHCDMPMRLESRHTLVDESIASQGWCVKRPRIDHVESYKAAVRRFLLQRWERVMQGVVKEVRLEEAWVSLRHRTHVRPRDRADGALRPSELPQGDEEGTVEDRVTVHSLLGSEAQVTLLLGQAGSGKTLLMHCLGQKWTQDASPSFHLLILLEFRQLNLVARPLSLKELLFRFFLPPEGGEEECTAVLDFILENPEKICLIFDGYDEFHTKITHSGKLSSSFDPLCPLPMAELISGLCSRRILPGCTLLITCRPWDVTDLESSVDCIGELLGFNQRSVKEYAEQYFQDKGLNLKEKAVSHLLANHHLLTMCYLPALCHICCVCLDYIFSSGGSELLPQLPNTLTQVYLQILCAFLSRCPGSSTPLLQSHRAEVTLLGRLAMRGLEGSKIVFLSEEVPPDLVDFATKAGLLSQVDLTHEDGSKGQGYTFMHLTMQEFLGALHIMTSDDITEAQLRKKFNLKTRWTMKSNPKMVFTDSLHLYVCGLAAPACFSYLLQLVQGVGAVAWVKKRLALVRKLLRSLAMSTNLTGPKVVELCHCVQETQDAQLAREMVGSRPCFELRNITLNPVDLDALAFVVSSAGVGIGLDFGACSMELECLDILPSCQHIDFLIFRSRKYDDRFADKLSCILPRLPTLKRFEFICGNLTDVGAAKLARALESCPQITELKELVCISNNSLGNKGLKKLLDLLPQLSNIQEINMSHVQMSTDGVLLLVRSLIDCQRVRAVELRPQGEAFIKFVNVKAEQATCRLTQYTLSSGDMEKLSGILEQCPHLSDLDLSSNLLRDEGVKSFVDSLPRLRIASSVNLNDNRLTQMGALYLVNTVMTFEKVAAIEVSLGTEERSLIRFEQDSDCGKTLSIEEPWITAEAAVNLLSCCLNLNPNIHTIGIFLYYSYINRNVYELAQNWLLHLSSPYHMLLPLVSFSLVDCAVQGHHLVSLQTLYIFLIFLFSLSYNSIGRVGAEFLCSVLPSLASLRKLSLETKETSEDVVLLLAEGLLQAKSIESLNLSGHMITDREAVALTRALQNLPHLRTINLSLCYGWTPAGALELVRGLGQCLSLEGISLDSVQLDEESTVCLAEGLHAMTSLKRLNLNNKVTMVTGSPWVGATLVLLASLEGLRGMEELELEGMRISDNGVEELIKHLPTWTGLRKISLSENEIGTKGSVSISKALISMKYLTKIHLTSIGTSELAGLADSLAHCVCAEDVSFAWNDCGDDVAVKLAEVLPQCQKLRRLDLESNSISTIGAEALARSLQSCPSVEVIRLWRNFISTSDAQKLRQKEKRLNFSST
uniref:NACHT domain-containing protein n=1 Tax=Oncorhynchus tshawytscha TaxID=74940 RepID=A0A8C8D4C3_ONCTS